ncbi:hypothetical protein D910_10843 [Dendroctonus ponderosae]|uniref:Uncharacterized protein n=1 Tax=Dendroctonus ponderosae TaxID=77166 RepID=U4UHT1_DENPD|nr:hypothetical protein D910_10843 [Dendroctonus ponderosae]
MTQWKLIEFFHFDLSSHWLLLMLGKSSGSYSEAEQAKQNCPGGSMQLFPGVCKPIFKLNPEVKCNCRETPAKASETMKKAQVWLVVLLLGILLLDYVHCTFMNYTSFLKADETKQGHLFYSQNCAECYLYKAGRCIRIFGCKQR